MTPSKIRIGGRPLSLMAAMILVALTPVSAAVAAGAASGAVRFNWSAMETRPTPPPLAYAAAAYDSDNNTLVLFGGRTASGTLSNNTWVWNGTSWADYPGSQIEAPPARDLAAMSFDPVLHQLILFGGLGNQGHGYGDTWAWNGLSWYQEVSPVTPAPRYGASISYDGAGHLILFGGATESAWISDSSTSGSSPATSSSSSTTSTPSGTVEDLGDTWLWTSSGWVRSTASGPSPRAGAAMGLDPSSNQVVLFSGSSTSRLADTWVWKASRWVKMAPSASPPARAYAIAEGQPSAGGVALFGGVSGNTYLGDTWLWNGSNWVATTTHGSPPPRAGATGAFLSSVSEAVIFGGENSAGHVLGDAWALTVGASVVPPPTTSTTTPKRPTGSRPAGPSAADKHKSVTTPPLVAIPRSRASSGQPDWLAANVRAARRGQTVILSGSGFAPGAAVTISFHSRPENLGHVTAGSNGQFVASVTVPRTAAGGTHHFEASGPAPGGRTANVIAAVQVIGVPGSGPSTSETVLLVVAALLLPAGTWVGMSGAGLVRRRRKTSLAKPAA
jgi:hypothetical protein